MQAALSFWLFMHWTHMMSQGTNPTHFYYHEHCLQSLRLFQTKLVASTLIIYLNLFIMIETVEDKGKEELTESLAPSPGLTSFSSRCKLDTKKGTVHWGVQEETGCKGAAQVNVNYCMRTLFEEIHAALVLCQYTADTKTLQELPMQWHSSQTTLACHDALLE